MKITVNTKEIQAAIKNLLKVSAKKPVILDSVKIEAVTDIVYITATNVEVTTTIKLKHTEVLEPGTVILSRDTYKFISKLTDNQMTITNNTIESGKRTVKYSSLDAASYPKAANRNYNQPAFTVDKNGLSDILSVTYACSESETTPILQGVLFRGKSIVATDRHRLAIKTLEKNAYEKDMTLSGNALNLITSFLDKKYTDHYTFSIDKKDQYVQIKFDNITMEIKIIEGIYPDVSRIIPSSFKTEVVINKNDLIEELKILKEVVTDKTKIVKINVINGKFTLYGESEQEGSSLSSELDSSISGEDILLGANMDYILDALKSIDDNSKSVTIKFTGKASPFMINENSLLLPYRNIA